ncbi:hypothetical protein F5Y19DRAFT_456411 [Xylariaceae sp. FL1651]|nr:hypothetical protein F5Y19DRAFT_456411 [Xylariaceae sp. FL1651]
MPIAPSRPDLCSGEHKGSIWHQTSFSEVSGPKLPPDSRNNTQKSVISRTPIENNQKLRHHVQGEHSLERVQSPQQTPHIPPETNFMEILFNNITDFENGGDDAITGTAGFYAAITPNDTPDLSLGSLSSGRTSSSYSSEGTSSNVTVDIGFDTCYPFAFGQDGGLSVQRRTTNLSGLTCPGFAWDEVNPDFDKPFSLDTSFFQLNAIDHHTNNSQPPISNVNNKEGKLPEHSPTAQAVKSVAEKSHGEKSTERESGRLDADDIRPLLGETIEGSSQFNSTPESADESTTSSDYDDDDIASDISDDILRQLKEPLLQKLLYAYSTHALSKNGGEREAKGSKNSGVSDSAICVATGKQTVVSYQYPSNSNPSKRKRQGPSQNNGNDEDEEEEEELPPRKRAQPLKEGSLLACPFAKWKPLSYQSCYKYRLKEINRVKQHLHRYHRMPLYCPTCWEIFKDEKTFYPHIQSRSCFQQPRREIEGMTSTQQQHLERKADRKLSQSGKWYSIFSILFPGSPLPKSAYLESDLSAELLDFQKFMATDGLAIVEQTVHEQIPANLMPQTEEIVTFSHVLFQQAIPEILKKYEATRPHNSSPDSGYESLCLPGNSNSMPDEHRVDEGSRLEAICETADPIPNDPSLAAHASTWVSDDLLVPNKSDTDSLGNTMAMEELFRFDTTWDEHVQNYNLSINQ